MKWPRPSGWQCIVYSSFVVALVCIIQSIDEIRFESLFKLDRIPLFLPKTFHHSTNESTARNTPPKTIQIPLNCTSLGNRTRNCPANYYPKNFFQYSQLGGQDDDHQEYQGGGSTCPDYFRWIYEDLQPWKETGITAEMVERAWPASNFRLVIVDGRAYVDRRKKAPQTSDVFTQWGILQLLRRYPGKLPDLDLMFSVADRPVIKSEDYHATTPPPLFRYCGDDDTVNIVFPDWSFWGWAEINIKPWEELLEEIKEEDKRKRWMDKEAYAFWRGNPRTSASRMELMRCNVSHKQDWGAHLYKQDWNKERAEGYKQSNQASQCTHRYKIYVEGIGWSVSEKYILACNSVTLLMKTRYYDFFSRGLMPMHHYWPINDQGDKCRSIKFAVEWGNSHEREAQDIGKAGSDFIREDLKMDYVYDYMFHVLSEYAKLLRYKPTIPERALEICSETFACPRPVGVHKTFMMESMVKSPTDLSPCNMPPPYDALAFQTLLERKANAISQVELWEKKYWENQTNT
ncbi:uncharacterized protein LOC131319590 isoform X1 [Rhododendron vialii]|uniref:uncharacterized protein LOC131319590 isoform X1 n=1 Tax=Rhododendron vialii TaxID=182163 RepID=UPI00265FA735|nr:uncharacterized protein LOC131319590 isoform X1 [Rhododendron vialii]